jgi:hypothetical protein
MPSLSSLPVKVRSKACHCLICGFYGSDHICSGCFGFLKPAEVYSLNAAELVYKSFSKRKRNFRLLLNTGKLPTVSALPHPRKFIERGVEYESQRSR